MEQGPWRLRQLNLSLPAPPVASWVSGSATLAPSLITPFSLRPSSRSHFSLSSPVFSVSYCKLARTDVVVLFVGFTACLGCSFPLLSSPPGTGTARASRCRHLAGPDPGAWVGGVHVARGSSEHQWVCLSCSRQEAWFRKPARCPDGRAGPDGPPVSAVVPARL